MSPLSKLSTQDRQGLIIFSVIGIFCVLIFAFYFAALNKPKTLDPITLCDSAVKRNLHTVYVIDASDKFSVYQKNFIQQKLKETLISASLNDRISVYLLDTKRGGLSDSVVDICKPRSGEKVNEWSENRDFIKRLHQEKFIKPLQKAIEGVVESSSMPVSPIQEGILDLKQMNLMDTSADIVSVNVFSDMLQNTQRASVYKNGAQAVESLPPMDLSGARITVYWLDQENRRHQTPRLVKAWANYFSASHALDKIERVRY